MTGTELAAMLLKGSSELTSSLVEAYVKKKIENDPEKAARLRSNIIPRLEATFKRCSQIKTLLNPLTPTNFLAIHATQRFSVGNRTIDHYSMVDHVKTGPRNIILSGTGGSGKSMFTRYLWLSLYVNGEGKLPIFVELRNLNSISSDNFLTFLNYYISQGSASLTHQDFQNYPKNGDFFLILDGFDEVLLSKKEAVQGQILLLAENFPKVRIFITSRPEQEFGSWPSFEVSSVAPLYLEDVVELIEKAEFDDDSKSHFLKRLKDTDLFQKHESFLTNPLLASMMLLTFSYKFDIPDRMHLFYEQSFDALFQRHDAFKPGGYKRQFKTSMSEDSFKRVIAYSCLITYNKEKTNFARGEVIEFLESAIKLARVESGAHDILDDLISCVCFLILDGIVYSFSHRSFQEYFTARCLSFLKPEQFMLSISKFSKRVNDQVIFLLSDMNPDLLRR